jgi:hypothetical protein
MTRSFLVLAGLLLASLPTGSRAADCSVPPELIEDDPRLPELAQRLKARQAVTVVAIGGASTAGTAAGMGEENAYPRRLEEALKKRHPGVPISVINKGVARQTAEQMIQRFPADVYANGPALVIWETGTPEAVRATDVEAFAGALQAGIAELRDHHIEIMMMDMQFNRNTTSVINYEPYLDALHRTADLEDVYLFRRYEIMRYWGENGVFDFLDVPQNRRAGLASEVYQCLAERLADAIDFATR